jgi:hypothetical protein
VCFQQLCLSAVSFQFLFIVIFGVFFFGCGHGSVCPGGYAHLS